MKSTWREQLLTVIGIALAGIVLGLVMGLIWWWVTPTEQWIKTESGLGAAQLTTSSWFAADGWFLVLGVVAGLLLTCGAWYWGRPRPFAVLLGVLLGTGLISVVAWSLGGVLGAPDPYTAASSAAIGSTVEGSLGLRALGVLAAPAVSGLALLSLLLATVSVSEPEVDPVPEAMVGPTGF